jgi:hypothetical protein
MQLLLNLLMLPLAWSFLRSLRRRLSRILCLWIVFFVWLAGLGFAIQLLSDLLAGVLFNIFLLGFCFRRTRGWLALAGASLFLATVTRPGLNYFFLLLPFLALLVRRFAAPLAWREVGVYCLLGFCGMVVNEVQGHYFLEVKGTTRSLKEWPVQLWNYELLKPAENAYSEQAIQDYRHLIEQRAGRPYADLTRREKEATARLVLCDLLSSHPLSFCYRYAKRVVQILIAPMDNSLVYRMKILLGLTSENATRWKLYLFWLPVWLVAYIPGKRLRKEHGAYFLFYALTIAYFLGLTALATGSGGDDRYRLPLMMCIMSTIALQLDAFFRRGKTGKTESHSVSNG